MGRLVVVSNRVAAAEDAARAGGLSVALRAALKAGPALWFGWSGERAAQFTGALKTHRVDDIDVVTLDLEDADFDEYYNGYANAALWPIFHSRTDLADYTRSFGKGYARVNRRFAEALAPLLRADDLVWVHDYHLIPLGRELRRLGVGNSIGFFLHIPWPAPQLFATLPQHADLAEAMFAYDLVGFQTGACVDAFADYVTREARGRREGDLLSAFGRSTLVGAFPIGIDTPQFLRLIRTPAAERAWDRMAAHGVFRSLIVGVDRLDYSKGLPERLLGFEQFLREHPDLVRKVLYLQIAPSSREGVEAYQTLRAQVLALAGRINATWADMDHAPMLCVNRNYDRAELAGIYRAARVGLVTPLRDGMNLVAKEYVAAQDPDDPGVLVLSRFAGAAEQMTDAMIVNPYCAEELAEAIGAALEMPRRERVRRWSRLMEGVERCDVRAWRDDFVAALTAARGRRAPEGERPVRAARAPNSELANQGLASQDAFSAARDPAAALARGRGSATAAPEWRRLGRG
jgi:trehalose 6-phosphate synthase